MLRCAGLVQGARRNGAGQHSHQPAVERPEPAVLGGSFPPDDLHNGVLGKPNVASNQAIGQALAVQGDHLLGLLVRRALANLSAEDNALGLGCRQTALDALRAGPKL